MKELISLSNGEWKLMKLLWSHETMTVGQIVDALAGDTDWNKNTVFTMLKRLEEKQAIAMVTTRRPQQYAAVISREEAAKDETDSFLSRVYDGNLKLFVSALSGNRSLSQEEINEIREFLNQAESKLNKSED